MPPPSKPTDPDHYPFELAPNLTLGQWKGMNKQGSSSNPKDDEIRLGINIRPSGDGYRERGGQEKIISPSVVGPIEGIFEFTDIGAPGDSDLIEPPAEGFYSISLSGADGGWFARKLPGVNEVQYPLPSNAFAFFCRPFVSRGLIMVGHGIIGGYVRLYQWTLAAGITIAYAFTVPRTNATWPGLATSAGCEFSNNFYFSLWYYENLTAFPTPHHQLIYRWDGVAAPVLELDYIVLQNGAYPVLTNAGHTSTWGVYSDGLDVFALQVNADSQYFAGGNIIKKRNGGDWDTLPMPGTCLFFGGSARAPGASYGAVVRYNGNTYIAGLDQAVITDQVAKTLKILKWDGISLSEVWSYAMATYDGDINLFVADGILYYNYTAASGGIYRTGSFDGATWNDTAKIWSNAPQSLSDIPKSVVEADGEFWARVGAVSVLYKTVSRNVTGLWVADVGTSAGRYLDVVD